MAKLTLSPIGAFTQSAITTINQNMDDIEAALEKTLSRDGTTPNQMTADFDMNENDILNVDNLDANNIILNGEVLIPGDISSTSAQGLLDLIKTVDGTGSGLDADLVRGTTPGTAGLTILAGSTNSSIRSTLQVNQPWNVLWTTGVDPTNTTDSVAGLIAAEANGSIYIPDGSYKIATNWSPTVGVKIASNAKLYIATGVTINFAAATVEIHAPKKQRFYITGTGAVTGLEVSHAGWFAGDKLNTTNNALTELQKWAASVSSQGELRGNRGYYTSDGSDYIQCSLGQNVIGFGAQTSILRFSGTATKGFRFSTTSGPTLRNFGFDRQNSAVVATSGEAVLFDTGAGNWQASGLWGSGLYICVKALAGGGKLTQFDVIDTRLSAVHFESCNDNQASQGIIAATSSWLVLSGVTGTFVNETITYTGGSGTIFPGNSTTTKAILTTTEPAPGATITGATSGATATVVSVTHPHALGGIRVYLQGEAHLFSDIDAVGGTSPLILDAVSYTAGNRPLTCVFTGCLFDSGKSGGVTIAKSVGTKFIGCWFSNRPADSDVYIVSSFGTTFTDCEWTNTYKRAMLIDTGSENTQINGGFAADFNTSNTAATPAFLWAAGTTGSMRGVSIGKSIGYGGHPTVGVSIGAGCVVSLDNVDASSCTTPIINSSAGTAKIRNCLGYKTYNAGVAGPTTDANGEANIAHGLAEAPVWCTARTEGDSAFEFMIISSDATNIRVRLRNTTTNADVVGTVTCVWEARATSAV